MKKKLFSVIAMFIAITFSLFLFSCQQDEEILSSAPPAEEIVIKMSIPSSSSVSSRSISDQDNSATSASSNSDYQNIKEGDTVDVYNIRNINILISAESAEGSIIEGNWFVRLTSPEIGLCLNDQGLDISGRPFASASKKSMVAIKPEKLGIYTVDFQKDNTSFTFYIRHSGIPGDTGDVTEGDYSFRMEKNTFQVGRDDKNGYTIYLKSDEFILGNYISGNKVKALVYTGNGSIFTAGNGSQISAEELTCYKCEYSPGYIFFSFLPSEITPISGIYTISFYAGSYYLDWIIPSSVYKSNWSENGQIRFMDMK